MFDFRDCRMLIAVAFVIAGCDDNSERMNLRIGLFFTEDTQALIMPFEPYHYPVMDPGDDVPVGSEIVSTLTRATRGAFTSVDVLNAYPTKESIADSQLNLVVVVQVRQAGGSLGYEGDRIQNSSEASRSLTAELTCFNADLIEIASITASGKGNATAKGILFDSRRKAFVGAVKSALRNLGDDVVLQMFSNPEIRKMAE